MLYVNKIRKLVDDKNLTLKKFAEKIGVSEPGMHNMLRTKDMKVSTLIKIAEFFDVPVTYFFDENDFIDRRKTQTVDLVFEILKDIVKERIE